MKMVIPFGPMAPDSGSYRHGSVQNATNIIPGSNGYSPWGALNNSAGGTALTARCQGAIKADTDVSVTNYYHYAGDATKLYECINKNATDESKGGGYSTSAGATWAFAQWDANRKIIATNYTDPVQSIAIAGGASGAFADMMVSTLKPKAKYVAVINQFVVLGFTNDTTDGEQPQRVWWSGFGDETDFDPDSATQCDYEDLSDGGPVTGIIGGNEYGLIFQQNAVHVMRYVGGTTIFDIKPLNYAPGTIFSNTIIQYQDAVYYLSYSGFYRLSGGAAVNISSESISRHLARVLFAQPGDFRSSVFSSAVSPWHDVIMWAIPTQASATKATRLICYHVRSGNWSIIETDVEFLVRGLPWLITPQQQIMGFNTSHQLAPFGWLAKKSLSSYVETSDLNPQPGKRWQINSVRPIVEGGENINATVSVASRDRMDGAISYGTAQDVGLEGFCNIRSAGRFQRIKCSLTSSISYSHFVGLEVDYEILGDR